MRAIDPDRTDTMTPLRRVGLLRDLDHPGQVFAHIGPNWFASIMGTGIVAVAADTLPVQFPGLHVAAVVVWLVSAVMLVALTGAWVVHMVGHPRTVRGHVASPIMVQFYGAPPMALVTVGAGTVLLGPGVLGETLAVTIDWVLWTLGTVAGLACAVIVPFIMITRHRLSSASVFGGWLMPVVPPMVSSATGALLVPYAAAGQARLSLLLVCYAMFGLSLIASLFVTTLIWYRLMAHGPGRAATVPTLWIVLGWVGQSITAANLLGGVAHLALPAPFSTAFEVFGLVYGLPVFGFGMLWMTLVVALTVRAAREHLPFSLTWWSFTFPTGTLVTGTGALALHTGSRVLEVLAVVLFGVLAAAWLTVAARTTGGSLRGRLFLPPS